MNFKHFFIILALFISSNPGHAMVSGGIIDGKNSTHVIINPFDPKTAALGLTLARQASSTLLPLFSTKGLPVLISSAASAMPWWALTTGTGYLLITQCAINDPSLIATLIAAVGYAGGEIATKKLQGAFKTTQSYKTAQAFILASCLGLAYCDISASLQTALVSMAQSVGTQAGLEIMGSLIEKSATHSQNLLNSTGVHITLPYVTTAAILGAGLGSYHGITSGALTTAAKTIAPYFLLKTLLYEQAYRLAKNGSHAAQQFLNTQKMPIKKIVINPELVMAAKPLAQEFIQELKKSKPIKIFTKSNLALISDSLLNVHQKDTLHSLLCITLNAYEHDRYFKQTIEKVCETITKKVSLLDELHIDSTIDEILYLIPSPLRPLISYLLMQSIDANSFAVTIDQDLEDTLLITFFNHALRKNDKKIMNALYQSNYLNGYEKSILTTLKTHLKKQIS